MAADDEKKAKPLRIAVSARVREYLGYLAHTTNFGTSENDVALHVLTEELERMRRTPEYGYRFADQPDSAANAPSTDGSPDS
jgi:hypothetical protein